MMETDKSVVYDVCSDVIFPPINGWVNPSHIFQPLHHGNNPRLCISYGGQARIRVREYKPIQFIRNADRSNPRLQVWDYESTIPTQNRFNGLIRETLDQSEQADKSVHDGFGCDLMYPTLKRGANPTKIFQSLYKASRNNTRLRISYGGQAHPILKYTDFRTEF